MTTAQIKSCGIATDKWDTLEGVCNQILFNNEGKQFVNPSVYQFYFDTTNELLFVRYTTGRPITASMKDPHKEYAEVHFVESGIVKTFYIPLVGGGVNDTTIGRYHTVYDSTKIIAIS